jgi:hypothetical protein
MKKWFLALALVAWPLFGQSFPCNRFVLLRPAGTCVNCVPSTEILVNSATMTAQRLYLPDKEFVVVQVYYGDLIAIAPPLDPKLHWIEYDDLGTAASYAALQYAGLTGKVAKGLVTYKDNGGCGQPPRAAVSYWWIEP